MDDEATAPTRGGWFLPAVLAVLLVAVLATALILLKDRRDAAEIEPLRPADIGNDGWTEDRAGRAVVAARTAAATYFTLDHLTVADDMDEMRALGTDEFVDEYDAAARSLAERITTDRLTLSAVLPAEGTATEFLVTDRAQVLVSVDVTTASDEGQRTTRYRTRVALDLVEGDWLVSALDEVT